MYQTDLYNVRIYIGPYMADPNTYTAYRANPTDDVIQISFVAPFGQGKLELHLALRLSLLVPNGARSLFPRDAGSQLPVIANVTNQTNSYSTAPYANFTFAGGTIDNVTSVDTTGGMIKIRGQDIGPPGTVINYVYIGRLPFDVVKYVCSSPFVNETDTVYVSMDSGALDILLHV